MHTHGGGNDPGYENFSDTDIKRAYKGNYTSYLFTPDGQFKKYTPGAPANQPSITTFGKISTNYSEVNMKRNEWRYRYRQL